MAPSGPAVPPETAAARAPAPAESTSGVAQRAVEAVLTAAERSQSAGQHSVNLQFSLSGVDLAVRVQLRSGAVHATFRTDSPELRSALAEEWHSVSAQSAGAPLRMVAPVFTSKEAMSSGHFQGGGGSPGRETGGRRPAAAPSFAVPAASAKPAAALSSPVSAAPGRAAARLHVLA